MVISIKNEENSITEFIDSIIEQTLLPEEVIFVDHFSTDKTVEKIIKKRHNCPFEIVLLSAKNSPQYIKTQRSTLAGNRNYGVNKAKNEFVLFTDCGNILNRDYFKSLIMPLYKDKEVDLVGGIYRTQSKNLDKIMTFDWASVDWNSFLPACRGQAVKKSIYLKCGGQPEWVTYAGEDAYYDFQYRKYSNVWVFNCAACITWIAPKNTEEIRNKFYAYGVGDGETGLGNAVFNELITTHFKRNIPVDVCNEAKFYGFCEGRNRRSQIDKIRNMKGIELLFVKEQIVFHESTVKIIRESTNNDWRVI